MNDLKKVRSSFLILVSLFILTLSFSMASATMRQEDGMVKELPLPEIPEELSTREQKMTYLLNHFWDAMDWDDPALKTDSLFLEQNLSNFFSVLALADSVSGQSGVNTLLNKVRQDPELSETIAGLAETYLYNPSSPFSNSESYLLFTNFLIDDPSVSEATRTRAFYSQEQILKNRLGTIATDFEFIDRNDDLQRLSDYDPQGSYTLLIFYDTDCLDCHELKRKLNNDGEITRLMVSGKLRIIAIDSFGAEKGHWLEDAASWPKDWIVGWSPEGDVDAEEIYVLRTTPTLYLLDSQKKIIGKDLKYQDLPRILVF